MSTPGYAMAVHTDHAELTAVLMTDRDAPKGSILPTLVAYGWCGPQEIAVMIEAAKAEAVRDYQRAEHTRRFGDPSVSGGQLTTVPDPRNRDEGTSHD